MADAIVALGGAVDGAGNLAPWTAARVDRAVEAFRHGVAPWIIFTGRTGVHGPAEPAVTEASAMARRAISLGVSRSDILLEERARDTLGNAHFTRRDLLDPNGWRSIRVVTSEFHLSRAAFVFRKVLGTTYDFAFTASFSGLPPNELIARSLDELRITLFLNEWLEALAEGDELSVDSLLRHHHPAYAEAPTLSREAMQRRLEEIGRINRIEGTGFWPAAVQGP